MTRRVIDGLVEDGWLHRVHTGVYTIGPPRLDRETRWLAATLATDGVLSHCSAGEHWGILSPRSGPVHVTRARKRSRRARVTRSARHSRATIAAAVGQLRGRSTRRRCASPAAWSCRACWRDQAARGAKLQALLAEAVDPQSIDSLFELYFLRFCRNFRLGTPETQVAFGVWTVDFLFRGAGVVIETDSRRWHSTAARRARDARKTAYLESLGLVVLRVTWSELRDDSVGLARRIELHLIPRDGG